MIPIHLSISGFLSYRDPVDIDFTGFELACIAGSNGAGKSSLLDAITWALFGQARKRDDSLINTQSSTAEVCLDFSYEGNTYRVQRTKPKGKTTLLEFHILQETGEDGIQQWKPLTEHTLRQTDTRIQQTLRMDYETFINASFFLQGKADQFTQQRPGDRKRILSSILDLDIWEDYRQRAAEKRRAVDADIAALDGRLHEIMEELAEEEQRKKRLTDLESELETLGKQRLDQEAILKNIRQVAATLVEQKKWVQSQARRLEQDNAQLEQMHARMQERCQERDALSEILSQAEQIKKDYTAWQEKKAELERWEAVAQQFREHEARRAEPRAKIQAEGARLEGEAQTLRQQAEQIEIAQQVTEELGTQIAETENQLVIAETRLERRAKLEENLHTAKDRLADAKAENPRLKAEMNELDARITQLKATDGAQCPLCGQPLDDQQRIDLIAQLNEEGTQMGDKFRANKALLKQSDDMVSDLQSQINELRKAEIEARKYSNTLTELKSQLQNVKTQQAEWAKTGAPRLAEIESAIESSNFAKEARLQLAEIDAELKEIGYDAAAHDTVHQEEEIGRISEIRIRDLEKAYATLAPLEREIADLETQVASREKESQKLQEEYLEAAAALAKAQAEAPDLHKAEGTFFDLQERENRLRLEVGAAQQKVLVLDDLKTRQKELGKRREVLAKEINQYKQLERAFGKDGVPALLIEQALPEIETRANDILTRLSDGNMSIRFQTQAEYKDKKRSDMRETLDIQISDHAGTRDYEMFSGGEAFRVNFAIRLALSEVLTQRAGARLQTLVIDEGFGSQDNQGRQRLVEAINLVRADFAKVLVITHIEELKDAFPTRIEVQKTLRGSTVTVIQ
jgi:exonuclease SbcC